MQFYLVIDGEKTGPISHLQMAERIRKGEVTEETLVWEQGMDEWEPASSRDTLAKLFSERDEAEDGERLPTEEEIAERQRNSKPPLPDDPPLPSARLPATPQGAVVTQSLERGQSNVSLRRRMAARFFDYLLVLTLCALVTKLMLPPTARPATLQDIIDQMQSENALKASLIGIAGIIVWHIIEGVFVHMFGTTPGKALLRIRIRRPEGWPPKLGTSLARSFLVYVFGVGFVQFPFFIIGLIFTMIRFKTTGGCFWDQTLGLEIEGETLTSQRIVLFLSILALLIVAQVGLSI